MNIPLPNFPIIPLKAGIIGGAGYTGGELLRLLLRHPSVEIAFVQSRSQAGKPVAETHTDLLGETELMFSGDPETGGCDVLFLCLAHGEAKIWLEKLPPRPSLKIIDLSHDHRAGGSWAGHSFIYGLPELRRDEIRAAHLVANPGCFATGLQLALLPLAAKNWLGESFVTGITGATGAGQSLAPTSHFAFRHANISAYKTLQHQHCQEVMASLGAFGGQPELHFVPWRGDFPRGIFLSATVDCPPASLDEIRDLYAVFYGKHPFTILSKTKMIDLKMAVNTNRCLLFLEKIGPKLVIHAALDNLLKGASGQAVQNMNLMFGLDETAGLNLKASAF